jgi:chemotaxis protein MotB
LIEQDLVVGKTDTHWVEVEIKTDILFPSGSAEIGPEAVEILRRLATILEPLHNPIRVEGHTDNKPIKTSRFPSNWELSAARAARIVRLFEAQGIDSTRMIVAGMGEYQPVDDNHTATGRNRNRRVTLVVLNSVAGARAEQAELNTVRAFPGKSPPGVEEEQT